MRRDFHPPWLLVAAISAALAGCGTSSQAPPVHKTYAVKIQGFSFKPPRIVVSAGDTVVWTDKDPTMHTVTSATGSPVSFSSPTLTKGRSFRLTFKKTGTIHYHCNFHPFMLGVVVVRPHK